MQVKGFTKLSLSPVPAELHGASEVSGYLVTLWGFLRQSGVHLTEVTHTCCFFSLLFGEQDDDMMEAAKALLSIFLHLRYNKCTDVKSAAFNEQDKQSELISG